MTDQPPVDLAGVRAQAAVLRSSMRDTAAMLGAAADEIERLRAALLRVVQRRERSKRGHAIAARHYSGPESDRQNGR
jgi:hypothetical protein